MRVAIPFTGVDASGFGYGRTRSCPTFGAGYAAYMFGTSINDTPTVNLFTGANDGRLVGAPGAVGLVGGPMATAFSGAITGGNLLTVTGTVTGDPLAVGQSIELATGAGGSLGVISSLGTGTGSAGTYNLNGGVNTPSSSMRAFTRFFEVPGFARDIFNVSSALTLLAIYKSAINQGILTDDTNGGSLGMLVPGSFEVQTFGRDSVGTVVNVSTSSGFANGGTAWSMGVSEYNTTTAQGFIQRTGSARSASAFATTRTANPIGNTTRKLRTHLYTSTTPGATIAGIAVYTKMLSSGEMDDAFLFWRDLLADVGEVL
ncbi:hypothetical protein [Sphingomonas asaccharolytica]|uniref:hypothetical protein n=1 Tax=Sphingomonas asaccharolytica TaxID=40681 RepID=UPI00082B332E|nr:hypothetical protein [Sphingomonas asaccharolytica]